MNENLSVLSFSLDPDPRPQIYGNQTMSFGISFLVLLCFSFFSRFLFLSLSFVCKTRSRRSAKPPPNPSESNTWIPIQSISFASQEFSVRIACPALHSRRHIRVIAFRSAPSAPRLAAQGGHDASVSSQQFWLGSWAPLIDKIGEWVQISRIETKAHR